MIPIVKVTAYSEPFCFFCNKNLSGEFKQEACFFTMEGMVCETCYDEAELERAIQLSDGKTFRGLTPMYLKEGLLRWFYRSKSRDLIEYAMIAQKVKDYVTKIRAIKTISKSNGSGKSVDITSVHLGWRATRQKRGRIPT